MSKYGDCECGIGLQPIYFEEQETKVINGSLIYTGRKRTAVSHLTCPVCLKNYCVDDSFDGQWYN